MTVSTKERILDEALICFSETGYRGTNLRDLAQRLGLSKSALYKHFESKEDIWNSLLDRMEAYYDGRLASRVGVGGIPASAEELVELTMNMAGMTVQDKSIVRVRKLLVLEQYRDERAARLATLHFITVPKEIFQEIFTEMMSSGSMKPGDAELRALSFTAPISALVHMCDREPEKKEQILLGIRDFAVCFAEEYMTK